MNKLIFFILFLFLLLCTPSFQVNIQRVQKQPNIYKNYDLSILKKEYESIISDFNFNKNDYEKDLTSIYNQLNNIQYSNFTNFNDLEFYLKNNNNHDNNNNNNHETNNNNNNNINEKLKIGIIVSSFEGMYSTSGIGTVYSILSDFLVKTGKYNVTVIYTRDEPPEKKSFSNWKVELKERGINLVHLPLSEIRIDNPLFVRKSYQVYQYLKDQSFDVLHFPDFEGMAYYSCLAKKNGIEKSFEKVVIVVGLHGPSSWVTKSNTKKVSLDHDQVELDFMERKSVELADIIWTPSNYIVSWLINEVGWTIPRDNLYLLPFLPPSATSITNNKKTSSIIKEIVFFGRLEQRKGIVLFCDALDQLVAKSTNQHQISKLKVTFLGRSSIINDLIDSIDYIRDRSVSWPFEINFLDEKSSNQALEYLSDDLHKLVVIPSLEDNAPYTLYECLYNRIPFIASRQPSMVPLIEKNDQSDVLFDSNVDSLVDKLNSIIGSKHLIGNPTITKEKSKSIWSEFYSTTIVSKADKYSKPIVDNTNNEAVDKQPLVSICITHFNRPYFLKQALESIENQDYKNYEVILVDDGSTTVESIDYLYSLKKQFKEKDWKIIMTDNKYLGAARNTAVGQAKGKYLIFLDDDNYMYPNSISTYVKVATNTNANVVSSPHSIFNSTMTPITKGVEIQRQWIPLGPSLSVGLFKNCFGDANFFIDKSSFDAIGGFTEEIGVGLEDHEILAKLVIDGFKLVVYTEPLLYYRIHDSENQMIFTTDSKSNQMRYIRPFSQVLNNGHVPVLKILASNAINAQSKITPCNITLSSVLPNYGPQSGGSLVSIQGSGFNCGVNSVLFGGLSCSNPKVKTDSLLTCTTPQSDSGQVDIVVRGSDGARVTLMEGYNFIKSIAVKSCSLGDANGNFFSCSMSDPVDTSGTDCSRIFSTSTLQTLGSSPKCEWSDPSLLMVTFGEGESAIAGQQIEFLAGGIQTTKGDKNQFQQVELEQPSDLIPVADIKAPNVIDSCNNLILDGSHSKGGSGKPLTYQWSVTTNSTDNSITQQLKDTLINNATITIPNNLLTQGQSYSFTLKITNWKNKSDTTSTTVSKKVGSVLEVNISGPNKIRQSAVDLILKGNASATVCENDGASSATSTIKYKWTITPNIQLDNQKQLTTSTITIPANKWVYGTTYHFSLSATSGTETNYANVTVIISQRPIVATIKGADKSIPLNTIFTLDASQSVDPSSATKSNLLVTNGSSDVSTSSSFIYKWSCIKGKKDCGVTLPQTEKISFNSSVFGVGKFFFAVDVSPPDDPTRSGSASATVNIIDEPFIDVSIATLPTLIDPTEKLVLKSIVKGQLANSTLTFRWRVDEGELALPLSQAYSTPIDGRNLVLKAGALGPNQLYTFSVDVTNSDGVKGSASVSFRTEASPEGGDITCQETSGLVTDTFTITMGDQWTSNNGIKGYNFRYRVGNGPAVALSETTNNTEIKTLLPPGDITVIGYATSNNGIAASRSCKIKVSKENNVETVVNFLNGIIGDPSVDIYQLSVAIKIANSLVPNKSAVSTPKKQSQTKTLEVFSDEYQVIMPEEPEDGAKVAYSLKPSNPNQQEESTEAPITTKAPTSNKVMSEAAVATQVSQFKVTGIKYVYKKVAQENRQLTSYGISSVVDLICTSTDLSASVQPNALRDSMSIMKLVSPMMEKSQVLPSDFISSIGFLGNVNQQIVRLQPKFDKLAADDHKTVTTMSDDVLSVSNSLADALLYRTANGETPFTINSDNGLSITTFKLLPNDFNTHGQKISEKSESDSHFEIPSGVLGKHMSTLKADAEVSAKFISIPSNIHFTQKSPSDATVFQKTVSLEILNGKTPLDIKSLKKPIIIDMGKQSPPSGKEFKCGWWDTSKLEWSTSGCSTQKSGDSIQCKCDHLTQFGLLEYAKSSQNIWIIIGPVVGGVVFAAAMVGTVVMVKRKKSKDKKKKINKTKEQRNKEREDKKKQAKEKKDADKLEKENKKKEKQEEKKQKDEAATSAEANLEIPKTKKESKTFGDENDVQYILQEFKDIYSEAKKREQLKILKDQPISPVTSIANISSTQSTPMSSTIVPTVEQTPTTSASNNQKQTKDKAATTIQKAWRNYCNIKQLKKEAEVEELLDNIGELLSDGEQDPFEAEQQQLQLDGQLENNDDVDEDNIINDTNIEDGDDQQLDNQTAQSQDEEDQIEN